MALSSTKTFHPGVGDNGQYTLTTHMLGHRIISAVCKALFDHQDRALFNYQDRA